MEATLVSKFGIDCPHCGALHLHEEALDCVDAWEVTDVEDGITLTEPDQIEVYLYDGENEDGCIDRDEPDYVEVWQCHECSENYLAQAEAEACCKPDEEEE